MKAYRHPGLIFPLQTKIVNQSTGSVLKIQKIGTSRMEFHRFWFGRNGNVSFFWQVGPPLCEHIYLAAGILH